jgi:nucleotide-binding universal stress UspA family protein
MTNATVDTADGQRREAAVEGAGTQGFGFTSVVVGVDGGRDGRDAVALGAALCDPDGRLTLAHVSAGNAGVNLNFDPAEARKESLAMLERERAATGVGAKLVSLPSLTVGRGLHLLAEQTAADLLVVGSCKRGLLGRVFVGDDTRASLNGASCAVAVAPHGYADHAAPITTIGVAYNGTPEAQAALAVARGLAARHGAAIRALMVLKLPSADVSYWDIMAAGYKRAGTALKDRAERQLDSLGGVDGRVAVGVPEEELAAFGAELDLLVVGSRSYGPVRRLMFGSTSQHLARAGRCPLLVLPRPIAGSHVEVAHDDGAPDAAA